MAMPDPPPGPAGFAGFPEQAGMYLVTALSSLSDWDGVLREGERFVARYPSSMLFMSVRATMERALTEKRMIAEGVEGARTEVAALSADDQKNPCRTVAIYSRNRQWPAVRRTLEAMKPGQCDVYTDEFQWYQYGMAVGDFARGVRIMGATGLAFYSGDDANNLGWLAHGGSGFVSVAGHACGDTLRTLVDSFLAGDTAGALAAYTAMLPAIDAIMGVPNYGATTAKATLQLLGVLDNRNVRSPLVPLDDDELGALRAGLAAAHLL